MLKHKQYHNTHGSIYHRRLVVDGDIVKHLFQISMQNMSDEEANRIISLLEKYNSDHDAVEKSLDIEFTDKLN